MTKKTAAIEMAKTTIRIPREVWREGKLRAMDEHRDFQDIVSDALRAYCKQRRGTKR